MNRPAMRSLMAVCLACSLPLTACGDEDTGGGGGGGGGTATISIEQFPGRMASTFCAMIADCGGPLYEEFMPGDCVADLTAEFEDGSMGAWDRAVADGTIIYHPEEAPACLAAFRAIGCDWSDATGIPDACLDTIEGTVAVAGTCNIDEECVRGAYCDTSMACPGTCASKVAEGGNCSRSPACNSGLACDPASGTCEDPIGEGDACTPATPDPCGEFLLVCIDLGAGTACHPRADLYTAGLGETCDVLDQTVMCRSGFACAVTGVNKGTGEIDWTCVADGAAAGGSCNFAFPDICPDAEYCLIDMKVGLEGTCTARVGENQPCDSSPFACQEGLRCDSSTDLCVAEPDRTRARIDEACVSGSDCYSDFCDPTAMTCQIPECSG